MKHPLQQNVAVSFPKLVPEMFPLKRAEMVFKKTLLEFIFHQRKRESAFQDMGKPIKKNAELNYL